MSISKAVQWLENELDEVAKHELRKIIDGLKQVPQVRAKFTCAEINFGVDGARVTMQPVTDGSKENEEFYKWTPGGNIVLDVVSKDTAKKFETGQEYYVDFTPATE